MSESFQQNQRPVTRQAVRTAWPVGLLAGAALIVALAFTLGLPGADRVAGSSSGPSTLSVFASATSRSTYRPSVAASPSTELRAEVKSQVKDCYMLWGVYAVSGNNLALACYGPTANPAIVLVDLATNQEV
jgi:hypothetical protein